MGYFPTRKDNIKQEGDIKQLKSERDKEEYYTISIINIDHESLKNKDRDNDVNLQFKIIQTLY